jgi:ribosomal protein S18 acetylase RimI-like enzyme
LRRREIPLPAEIVDIRQFDAADFASLLKAECEVWNRNLHWDYAPSARLIASCLAEKRLAGYALVSGKAIHGYSFFLYEGEKGMIGNLFLEPGDSVAESACRLLERVLETLMATPGISRIEAQLPHFRPEQLAPVFTARGFEIFERKFMVLGLGGGSRNFEGPRAKQAAREFMLEPWSRRHDAQAARLLYSTYRGHVDAAVNDQYRSVSGAARLLENILHLRGCGESLTEASVVAIERATRRLAGLLALTMVRPDTAHIPQIAVAPEFQGRGAGGLMLAHAFTTLAKQGFGEVSLTVTSANRGAVRLYERLGFATLRTFGAYAWHHPDARFAPTDDAAEP